MVLFNQFRQFGNLFFLLIALSQVIPALRVGFLVSYLLPLAVVLLTTMIKEFYDDLSRRQKDNEINAQQFKQLYLEGGVVKKI